MAIRQNVAPNTAATAAPESSPLPPTLTRHAPITIAVDPVALVITECITVTSAMRKHPWWAQSSVSAILGGGPNQALPLDTNTRRVVAPVIQDEDDGGWRWGSRSKRGKEVKDNPLIAAFTKLRSDLRACKDIKSFDTPSLLHPFLQVIRSSSTSASITSLALIAVTKFLSYGVIGGDSPRLSPAMQLLAAAITHCRFPPSQQNAADEVVFMRILKLMEALISGPVGDILSDESVCSIMEAGLNMCCDPMRTQLLQRSVEIMMVSMCQVIFQRLKYLEWEAGDEPGALDDQTRATMDSVKMEPASSSVSANTNGSQTTLVADGVETNGSAKPSLDGPEREKAPLLGTEKAPQDPSSSTLDLTAGVAESGEDDGHIKPYSLPSIKELFRSLVDLLDPNAKEYTDTHRVMALRMVNVALEVAGPSIASHPSLAFLAKDTLCRHLFQLVRSENMAVLSESLRVAVTLIATCRSVLKLQQELYLDYLVSCLYPRAEIPHDPNIDPRLYEGVPLAPSSIKPIPSLQQNSSGRSTPVPVKDRARLGLEGGARKPDAKEAMVESIGALVRLPGFMTELFVNYDCEIDRHDLCADMVGLLSRNAFPDAHVWSTTNVPPLCLDALLGFVQTIDDRLDDPPVTEGLPSLEKLRQQRDLKKIIIRGTNKFNENPKAGIAFLGKEGVIENVDDPTHIARFVRSTALVDKKTLGEFLTKRENERILVAFIDLFDFSGKTVEESLREMLYTFRLPGESQLIERIITVFSKKYIEDGNHDNIANADCVLVLCYAIIMLNTDQHNPTLSKQKRMAPEDFMRNLRGTNGTDEEGKPKDFDPEYLLNIFTSIKTNEIILPEEHNNKNAYDHAWKELLVKIQSASDLTVCNTNIFDADMFAATWRPIVATLSYVFKSASEDAVFSRVFIGFAQCAHIASRHGITACLDQIVFSLSSISTLAPNLLPSTSLNTEVPTEDDKRIMVSETAVRFGRDDRAQQAAVMLFRALEGNEDFLRDGWEHIVKIMLNLFVNSLIPAHFKAISTNEFDLPPIPLHPPAAVVDREQRQAEGGLLSALSSYVSSFANDEPPEPSEQEIENTLSAVDCISECHFEDLIRRIGTLSVESLRSLVDTLLSQIPEDSSPRVIVVKSENVPPLSPRPVNKRKANAPTYDPTLVWVLELSTLLAVRDAATAAELGKDVAVALQTVLRNVADLHYVTVSRLVYYLLQLLRVSDEHDFLRAPVLLHAFAAFDDELLQHCAEPLIKGISECMHASASLRSEMATSPDFWDILHKLHAISTVAPHVFTVLEEMGNAGQSVITADNYEKTIALLDDFATAASVGAVDERRRDEALKQRGKGSKMPKPKHRDEVARGYQALSLVHSMTARVPSFIQQSHLEPGEAWTAYWSPIFRALTKQCLNPCREMRHRAFAMLQQTLLHASLVPEVGDRDREWKAIFDEILFPLIGQLLKPEVVATDLQGMAETRIQAAQILCKVFLYYIGALSEWPGLVKLWAKILQVMERLIKSGQGDTLEEAIAENTKNILLVLSSQGILVPPAENREREALWNETWKRLDRFLPDLFSEVFPEELKKPRSAAVKTSSESSVSQQNPTQTRTSLEKGDDKEVEGSEKKNES
ncbi:uncharacterized protein PV09_06698 [Verruconis gallopava]|uniref:SEC7 domain-containing protein n=1 Tax=Verruconis gallopava TaxID=253628 RepID=A0A0D2ARM7_9PEZI|nr:uncharacterized protein PV09_06698 [Verruconis gallopava]KIW01849.1 hypothetical protein PV09_06698 [Verruconis gallopava]